MGITTTDTAANAMPIVLTSGGWRVASCTVASTPTYTAKAAKHSAMPRVARRS